jgi:diguanylate cyclase (GGDEF)-like protein/PAS domain S-box-containing protein
MPVQDPDETCPTSLPQENEKMVSYNDFLIVGIGASAGGLEAFGEFFRSVPDDSRLAFVLVHHLDPSHASMLFTILQCSTKMPVVEVTDNMEVASDHVYVIHPNRDMIIFNGVLQLSMPEQSRGHRLPIDTFLHSLAEDQAENAIGVLLSGTGADGTQGLSDIANVGGMTIVQDPATAKYDDMPRSAILSGLVSLVLPVGKIPEAVLAGRRSVIPRTNEFGAPNEITSLNRILQTLRCGTGNDVSSYKRSTIRHRIQRRMAQQNIDDLDLYAHYLKEDPAEVELFFKGLLTPASEQGHDLEIHKIELTQQNEELQRTQSELQDSLLHYQYLYEFSPVAYLNLSSDGKIQKINLTGVRFLKIDRAELLDCNFLQFVAPEDAGRFISFLNLALNSNQQHTLSLSLQHPDGSRTHVQMDCRAEKEYDGRISLRATLTDITERIRSETEIEKLAFYDALTGLPNRRLLFDRWQQAMTLAARTQNYGAVLLVDLDDFKTLNDTYGHNVGDEMLVEVARRISKCVRAADTVARLGGDEFVVLLQGLGENANAASMEAATIADKLATALSESPLLERIEQQSSGCIGIALFNGEEKSVTELLKCADLALYRAKESGCGAIRLFEQEMQTAMQVRSALVANLRRGVAMQEFVVYCLPLIDNKKKLMGVETLLRWRHPTRGLLEPSEFIAMAEEKGMIASLDRFALRWACERQKAWNAHPKTADLTLTVNISAHHFSQQDFVAQTLAIIDRNDVNPHRLLLEITESAVIGTLNEAASKMADLKALGVRFSLDDFGVRYSSLSYLSALPLDQLKIDSSFVRSILTSHKDAEIARSIIELGIRLGMTVIAEGVETEEQREFLARLGCTGFQGFLFGEPVLLDELRPCGDDAEVYPFLRTA